MRTELASRLAGPLTSVRVGFLRDGAIDQPGLRRYVDRCVEHGATGLVLTYGDSLYSLLTDDEVVEVTRVVVDQLDRRLPLIAADRQWWTGQAAAFGQYCAELGVDALMVLPPDWTSSSTPETLVGHYRTVAAEIPVVLVTTYMRTRSVQNSLEIIERTLESVDNIAAIKDDVGGNFGARMTTAVSDSWAVIAGGSKSLHLHLWPFGAAGYLSTLTPFQPTIARQYWAATTGANIGEMTRIIERYDRPMFDALATSPGGFDAGLHGWAELVGIYGRWRRSPYHSLTDPQLDTLAQRLSDLELLTS